MGLKNREYLAVAVPFIFSTITQPLLGSVDTAVVGHLENPAFIAGVSVGAVIFNTMYWIFGFLRVSTTGYSAQSLDSSDGDDRMISFYRPLGIALLVGVAFILFRKLVLEAAGNMISPDPEVMRMVATYFGILIWGAPFVLFNYVILGWLMGQMKIKASLIMQISSNLLNILLDVLFVYVFSMEVAGIALATLISQLTSFAIGLFFMVRYGDFSSVPVKKVFERSAMVAIFKVNGDLMIRTICLLIHVNVFTAASASLGTVVLSSNSVLLQIQSLMAYLFDGFANASSVFAGRAAGRKDDEALRSVWRISAFWGAGMALLVGGLYLSSLSGLVSLFTDIDEVYGQAVRYGRWVALYPLFAVWGLVFYGVFTGVSVTGPVRNSTIMALALFMAGYWFFFDLWGNDGLWLALLLFYAGRSLFLMPFLRRTLARR
ncbi:MATE family efflux transporter [Dethiosulfovibrio sp. F2B]|uniref:MATE family efflux transporter n=1 Tax=Dethiosulfovibrio faecalis TaxID=2720018 RepID=UPI001F1A63F9|nr:MATE family efflux transporter [Dethiosulfovibrio faecalis]